MSASKLDIPQISRFLFWGGLNTAVSILVYWTLVFDPSKLTGLSYHGLPIWLANLIAIICGILLGHFLNKHQVFRSGNKNTLIKYFIMWSGLYVISTGLILLFVRLGSDKFIAAIFAGIALFPISYMIQKLKIFQEEANGNSL